MQMNTYFTLWHYLSILIVIALLAAAIVFTLRNKELPAKSSIIFTYVIVAIALWFMSVLAIDQYTKKVTLSNLENHRFLPTEKIIFTGMVRNTGDYTIGEVSVEIKIVNKDTNKHAGDPAYKSTAFEEFFGSNDSGIKASYYTLTEVVATDLKPGQSKTFRISMPYPPHFRGFSDYVRVSGH